MECVARRLVQRESGDALHRTTQPSRLLSTLTSLSARTIRFLPLRLVHSPVFFPHHHKPIQPSFSLLIVRLSHLSSLVRDSACSATKA